MVGRDCCSQGCVRGQRPTERNASTLSEEFQITFPCIKRLHKNLLDQCDHFQEGKVEWVATTTERGQASQYLLYKFSSVQEINVLIAASLLQTASLVLLCGKL